MHSYPFRYKATHWRGLLFLFNKLPYLYGMTCKKIKIVIQPDSELHKVMQQLHNEKIESRNKDREYYIKHPFDTPINLKTVTP